MKAAPPRSEGAGISKGNSPLSNLQDTLAHSPRTDMRSGGKKKTNLEKKGLGSLEEDGVIPGQCFLVVLKTQAVWPALLLLPSPSGLISSSPPVMVTMAVRMPVVVRMPMCGPWEQQEVGGGHSARLQLVPCAAFCLKLSANSHCLLIQKTAPQPAPVSIHSPDGYLQLPGVQTSNSLCWVRFSLRNNGS